MRARGIFVGVVALGLVASACTVDDTANPQTRADATPIPSQTEVTCPAPIDPFPSEEVLEIRWQTLTITIEPTSRYPFRRDAADSAQVVSTVAFPDPIGDEIEAFLTDLPGDVEIPEGSSIATLTEAIDVPVVEFEGGRRYGDTYTDVYCLPTVFPSGAFKLMPEGSASLSVLLPRSTTLLLDDAIEPLGDNVPSYVVEVVGTNGEPPEWFEPVTLKQRFAAFFYDDEDPPEDVVYKYVGEITRKIP